MSELVRSLPRPFRTLRLRDLAAWALLVGGLAAMLATSLVILPDYQKIPWIEGLGAATSGGLLVRTGRRQLSRWSLLHRITEHLAVTLAGFLAVKTLLLATFFIPSASMEPTLRAGDFLFGSKLAYGLRIPYTGTRVLSLSRPSRGEVVIFAYPLDDRLRVIKRIIAVGGDTVEVAPGRVRVNGAEIPEPWAWWTGRTDLPDETPLRAAYGPVRVPAGKVFVMGDNRNGSYDSRYWGFVDEGRIEARALVTYWSWNKKSFRPRWSRIGKLL